MRSRRIPPVALLGGALGVQQILAGDDGVSRVRRFLAGLAGAASTAVLADALLELRRNHTTVDPMSPEEASSLVTSGVFAVSRNPIYLGMAGLIAANALRHRSWSGWVVLAAFVVLIDRGQIPAEEDAMAELFGSQWETYRQQVPRWL